MTAPEPMNGAEGVAAVPAQQAAGKPAEGTSGYSANTTVSSMADLQQKAPEVLEAMKQGIAMRMISDMRHRQERLKKMMREGRRSG